MKVSVMLEVPREYQEAYRSLNECREIDYQVMSADNFTAEDIVSIYVLITADPVATAVVSEMIVELLKKITHEVLIRLKTAKGKQKTENSSETHVRLLIRETPLENGGVQIEREVIVNKPLDNDHICELIDKLVKLVK